MIEHPSAESWCTWLGHSPSSPQFSEFLDRNGIECRPHHAFQDEEYDENPGEAEENASASLIQMIERFSVYLIYLPSGTWRAQYGAPLQDGDFILSQVAFYSRGVQGFSGFRQPMLHGLPVSASRKAVQTTLGTPSASRSIHELVSDLYIQKDRVLSCSYLDGGAQAASWHVRPPHRYDLLRLGQEPPLPAGPVLQLANIHENLGLPVDAGTLRATLAPLGWKLPSALSRLPCEQTDYILRYGLTLWYRKARDFPILQHRGLKRSAVVLAGYAFSRAGDQQSDGYYGTLPLKLSFHMTPEEGCAQMGFPADEVLQEPDSILYTWHYEKFSLLLLFSLIDYQLYRVTVLADFMILERPQPSN